jgi:hypothetical protein
VPTPETQDESLTTGDEAPIRFLFAMFQGGGNIRSSCLLLLDSLQWAA